MSSVFVEHQCRPSGSDSVIQNRLNLPWNLKGNTQGVFGLGLSLVVTHFCLWALMLIKITKRTITEQILFMVMTQLIAWSSATIFFQAVKSRSARANTKLKLVPPNWICDFYRICGICQDSTEQSKVLKLWNEELLYCAVKNQQSCNHDVCSKE